MPAHASDLPLIRSHERIEFKRCETRWYWHWRMGLQPKAQTFGALELGTWMHEALAGFYTQLGKGSLTLADCFQHISSAHMAFTNAPQHVLEAAEEGQMLGLAMAKAYDKRYGDDPGVNVIDAEVPLEFEITDPVGKVIALHKLKPDLVYADQHGDVWLMEHKTAKQIRTEHLVIDDQARPYAAMAELALKNAGVIDSRQHVKGVMYNFLRKALPDERPVNEKGQSLNKNGTVSKSQPSPTFARHPVTLTRAQKRIALQSLAKESRRITVVAEALRDKRLQLEDLIKTPHNSCPKTCSYFTMCVVQDQGGDIREMQRSMYVRENPYTYDEENPTADIPASFEIG